MMRLRAWLLRPASCLTALVLLHVATPVLAQRVTPISGFHAASDSDPFAQKGVLQITSATAPVVNLAGAHATVSMGCVRQNYLGILPTLVGTEAIPDIQFSVTLTGANIDIVTTTSVHTNTPLFGTQTRYATNDRTVAVKLRFDDKEPEPSNVEASDTHHLEILREPDDDFKGNTLLLGFSAGGTPIALRINLREPQVASMVGQCLAEKDRIVAARKVHHAQLEAQEKAENEARLASEKEHEAQLQQYMKQQRQIELERAATANSEALERHRAVQQTAIDRFWKCMQPSHLGPAPAAALLRQDYSPDSQIPPAQRSQAEDFKQRYGIYNDSPVHLMLRVVRPVHPARNAMGNPNADYPEVLPVGTILEVRIDRNYTSCDAPNRLRMPYVALERTFLLTPAGKNSSREGWIPVSSLAYETNGKEWCDKYCSW